MSNAVHLMQNSPESEVGIMPAALLIKGWHRRCSLGEWYLRNRRSVTHEYISNYILMISATNRKAKKKSVFVSPSGYLGGCRIGKV